MFYEHDLAPTDILAGLLLLKNKQQKHEKLSPSPSTYYPNYAKTRSKIYHRECPSPLSYSEITPAIHYYKFAEAVYGLPLYLFSTLNSVLARICCCCFGRKQALRRYEDLQDIHTDCCCFPPKYDSHMVNLPRRNIDGEVQNNTGDIVYHSLNNELYKSPFFVCFDHGEKVTL